MYKLMICILYSGVYYASKMGVLTGPSLLRHSSCWPSASTSASTPSTEHMNPLSSDGLSDSSLLVSHISTRKMSFSGESLSQNYCKNF
ncbi:unnamed protein product [Oppiella nova]|uniref:Uncharacterized protein n=1 Tax=Oppiella nova TaxID=334625 RepID=A0A7R9QAP0_9ACAR|nr:unnamed protein product [Oppiella nova]CAG2162081.1 unnamed protein product [Oppiella nova]